MTNTIYKLIQTQNGETKEVWWGTITQIETYLNELGYFDWIRENGPNLEGDKKYSIEKIDLEKRREEKKQLTK